jgi:hypothetical protein
MNKLSAKVKKEIKALLTTNIVSWKKDAIQIGRDHLDDYGPDPDDPFGDPACLELTVATNTKGTEWAYQIGDNSYKTCACYSLPHWSEQLVYEDLDEDEDITLQELYDEIVTELESLLPDNR